MLEQQASTSELLIAQSNKKRKKNVSRIQANNLQTYVKNKGDYQGTKQADLITSR